jgi:hypothetical protein
MNYDAHSCLPTVSKIYLSASCCPQAPGIKSVVVTMTENTSVGITGCRPCHPGDSSEAFMSRIQLIEI